MPPASDERAELEQRILSAVERGDLRAAATLAVRGYGPEIFGFLAARLHDETSAADAFSMFTEDLWRGLPGFERRSTLRVWAYTLARHAAVRLRSEPQRRRERNLPLGANEALSKLEARVRTDTAPFLKTEFKTRVARLRSRLSEDERTLLVLRVDRALEWTDIARIFLEAESEPSEKTLATEAGRLRKRFQLVKAKLRRMASEDE